MACRSGSLRAPAPLRDQACPQRTLGRRAEAPDEEQHPRREDARIELEDDALRSVERRQRSRLPEQSAAGQVAVPDESQIRDERRRGGRSARTPRSHRRRRGGRRADGRARRGRAGDRPARSSAAARTATGPGPRPSRSLPDVTDGAAGRGSSKDSRSASAKSRRIAALKPLSSNGTSRSAFASRIAPNPMSASLETVGRGSARARRRITASIRDGEDQPPTRGRRARSGPGAGWVCRCCG